MPSVFNQEGIFNDAVLVEQQGHGNCAPILGADGQQLDLKSVQLRQGIDDLLEELRNSAALILSYLRQKRLRRRADVPVAPMAKSSTGAATDPA
jgi:hypothetical protein